MFHYQCHKHNSNKNAKIQIRFITEWKIEINARSNETRKYPDDDDDLYNKQKMITCAIGAHWLKWLKSIGFYWNVHSLGDTTPTLNAYKSSLKPFSWFISVVSFCIGTFKHIFLFNGWSVLLPANKFTQKNFQPSQNISPFIKQNMQDWGEIKSQLECLQLEIKMLDPREGMLFKHRAENLQTSGVNNANFT